MVSLHRPVTGKAFTDQVNKKHNFEPPLDWEDVVTLFNSKQRLFADFFEDFSRYLSVACVNIVNLLDVPLIILEYRGQDSGDNIEKLLEENINKAVLVNKKRHVTVAKSQLKNDAALLGAVSMVLDKIFLGEIDYR